LLIAKLEFRGECGMQKLYISISNVEVGKLKCFLYLIVVCAPFWPFYLNAASVDGSRLNASPSASEFTSTIKITKCSYIPDECICCKWIDLISELIKPSLNEGDVMPDIYLVGIVPELSEGNAVLFVTAPKTGNASHGRTHSCFGQSESLPDKCYSNLGFTGNIAFLDSGKLRKLIAIDTNGLIYIPSHGPVIKKNIEGKYVQYKWCIESSDFGSNLIGYISISKKYFLKNSSSECGLQSYEFKRNLFRSTYKKY